VLVPIDYILFLGRQAFFGVDNRCWQVS